MSSPTETPSPLPSIVDDVAGNEERGPSPGRIHNTAPTTIAIDNEGGIPYVLRIIAQVGEGRPKEDTGVALLIDHHPHATPLETHIHVRPNPIHPFLPAGIPIHDPLVFASQLAQYYSDSRVRARYDQYSSS